MIGMVITAVCLLLAFIAMALGLREHGTTREDRMVRDAIRAIENMGDASALGRALSVDDVEERNRRYDAAQPFVRDQVDALLGMTTPNQSHDAGKPWKMDGIGRVISDD